MESHSYQVILCTFEPKARQRCVAMCDRTQRPPAACFFAAFEVIKTSPLSPSYLVIGPAVVRSPRSAPWSSRRRLLVILKDTSKGGVEEPKRVIVTPAVYSRLLEFLHVDSQSTGQKSYCVNHRHRNALL